MVAHFGFYLLFLAFICSVAACCGFVLATRTKDQRFLDVAKRLMACVAVLAVMTSLLLWYAFFTRDFSIQYVFKNASTDLPPLYTFTAFWCSLEGSHMMWTLLMSLICTTAVWYYPKENVFFIAPLGIFLSAVTAWMYYLSFTHSDLFAVTPYPQQEGRGMNALLQNPYMAIHPPLLFMGYAATIVPFGYSLAALIRGDVSQAWTRTVRRWSLFAWCFLTVAIVLGGRWAYVELGWAGYWAWDPVENASFIPWLFTTAALHNLIIQDRLGQLKRFTFALCIAAFFFTFMGTFITRSGVITSVHSFAESPIGPSYLGFLAGLFFLSAGLFAVRGPLILPSKLDKDWAVSKEGLLMVSALNFVGFAMIVFLGTMFPIVSEAISEQRISVQAPYYNSFTPYFGFILSVGIVLANLMRFESSKIAHARQNLVTSALAGALLSGLYAWIFREDIALQTFYNRAFLFAGVFLTSASAVSLVYDLIYRCYAQKSLRLFLQRNMAYIGSSFAHLGLLVMIFGFLGNLRGQQQEVTFAAGESKAVFSYNMAFDPKGMQTRKKDNVTLYEAPMTITDPAGRSIAALPGRSQYPTAPELFNEIAVLSSWWRDLYFVLKDFDFESGKTITLQVNYNPKVRFVWLATLMMLVGGVIALLDPMKGRRRTYTGDL